MEAACGFFWSPSFRSRSSSAGLLLNSGPCLRQNQNLVYGCQGLTACPRKNLELIAETRLTGKSFGYRETPFAFLDDFNTALEAIRQGWYERAFQRGLDGLLPMQNPPQKKAKGAVSAEFFN